jgi:hypothetical protein
MILEKDLEDMIYMSNPKKLREAGLPSWSNLQQQVRLGNYGIADLINLEIKEYKNEKYLAELTIIELKQGKIGDDALKQALRYAKGFSSFYKEYLEERNIRIIRTEIVLIGSKMDLNSDCLYLPDFTPNVSFYSTEIRLDGVRFMPQRFYSLTDEGQIPDSSKEDVEELTDIAIESFSIESYEKDQKTLKEYLNEG